MLTTCDDGGHVSPVQKTEFVAEKVGEIERVKCAALCEKRHIELSMVQYFPSPNVYKSAERRKAPPRGVQQIAGLCTQNDVDSFAVGRPHDIRDKGVMAGVEYAVCGQAKLFLQKFPLRLATHGGIYLEDLQWLDTEE